MKILFIVNPMSGRAVRHFSEIPRKYLNLSQHSYEIVLTEYAGHAEVLAKDSNAEMIVAVGGDGTVNEVGRAVIGSDKIMGVIPCGSGNGLARHLGLSNYQKAFDAINRVDSTHIDVGLINGHEFFCTCGIGLDAEVSFLFSNSEHRSLMGYSIDAIKAWRSYALQNYSITVDGINVQEKAVLITVGNANQWGNHAFITPFASVCDGVLDVTVLHDFNFLDSPRLIIQLFSGRLYNNRKVNHYRGKDIAISRNESGPAHVDGDPISMGRMIHISVSNMKLRILSNYR